MSINAKTWLVPIAPLNVFVAPVTWIVPSVVFDPLIVPAIVTLLFSDKIKVPPSKTIAVAVIAFLAVAVLLAATLILVALISSLKTVVLSMSINAKTWLVPIALTNVLVAPVTWIVPSVVPTPLIVPVMYIEFPENVAVASPVLSSNVIALTVTVFAKFANESSAAAFPPTMLIFEVPECVTVPLNKAEPALAVVPIVIVSATMLPENVIIPGATPFPLLITWRTVVSLSVILEDIVLAEVALNNNVP